MERAHVTPNQVGSRQMMPAQNTETNEASLCDPEHLTDRYELASDMEILKAIRNALHSDALIDENDILIKVNGGWVYLEGKVQTEDQRNLATNLATDIFGVTRVTNYLTFPRARFHSY